MHYNIFIRICLLLSRDTPITRHRSQEIMTPFKNRADLLRQMEEAANNLMSVFKNNQQKKLFNFIELIIASFGPNDCIFKNYD